ncbi:hypothetical protein GLYMA_04G237800v4 [Glycine max]|uniref:Uncharacterized protein n=1 Tax=Glycine max TaxID=3847 RepID=K7KLZ1_SOYBN|nr:hypothetical protein GYH30_010904 [Glycine max]KRH64498.1 hypothetical protein GLYMA_04G237800v4 [Glycine max]
MLVIAQGLNPKFQRIIFFKACKFKIAVNGISLCMAHRWHLPLTQTPYSFKPPSINNSPLLLSLLLSLSLSLSHLCYTSSPFQFSEVTTTTTHRTIILVKPIYSFNGNHFTLL